MKLGFLGFGYSAQYVAALAARQNPACKLWGTRRQWSDSADVPKGLASLVYDGGEPSSALLGAAQETTHLLISIPPAGPNGLLTQNLWPLFEVLAHLKWLGYCSTTGVYGDHQGAWVNEGTVPNPSSSRAQARLEEEQALLALGLPVHIFRLSGIYGPNRNAFERLKAGTARCIDKPNQYFSRIHVEDIAQTIYASMLEPQPSAIYNLADDLPCASYEPIYYAAELLGIAPPAMEPYDAADLSPMAREFYADSKRVSNDRIKQTLGVSLHYPTYKQGLKTIFDAYYR